MTNMSEKTALVIGVSLFVLFVLFWIFPKFRDFLLGTLVLGGLGFLAKWLGIGIYYLIISPFLLARWVLGMMMTNKVLVNIIAGIIAALVYAIIIAIVYAVLAGSP